MMRWLARRTGDAVATALVAAVVLLALMHLLPGDPLTALLRDRPADPAVVAALRARWGIDRTLLQTIGAFFVGLVHGDLGVSLSEQRPVLTVLGERIGPTLLLGGLTLLIDFTLGLAIGVWTALHPASIRARLASAATIIGYALPAFVVGLTLVWLFAIRLRWFPAAGLSDPLLSPQASVLTVLIDRLRHLALPLATMVIATTRDSVAAAAQRGARDRGTTVGARRACAGRAPVLRGVAPLLAAGAHADRHALRPLAADAGGRRGVRGVRVCAGRAWDPCWRRRRSTATSRW